MMEKELREIIDMLLEQVEAEQEIRKRLFGIIKSLYQQQQG